MSANTERRSLPTSKGSWTKLKLPSSADMKSDTRLELVKNELHACHKRLEKLNADISVREEKKKVLVIFI